MALVTGQWNTITLKDASDAAWTGYTPPYPTLPTAITEALINASNVLVFCIDDSGPVSLAYDGGFVTLDASVVATDTPETTEVTNIVGGEIWYSVRDGSGAWLWYSATGGNVQKVTSPTALGAFIS